MANIGPPGPGMIGPPRSLSPLPSRAHVPPSPLSMTPSTPGCLLPPASFRHAVQGVVSESFADSNIQAHAAWAYLSDVKMLEVAEQMLHGLVAPELLWELDRRDLVALLTAHQKTSTTVHDLRIVSERSPSPCFFSAKATRSPSPPARQISPTRACSVQQTTPAFEVARTGHAAMDATTTALMRARAGIQSCQNMQPNIRMQSARREAATGMAMRVPVLQNQRVMSSRNSARFGGAVGARGIAVPTTGRTSSPVIQRAVSSSLVGFDGPSKAMECSPATISQVALNWPQANLSEVAMERSFLATSPNRVVSSRGRHQTRGETVTMEATESVATSTRFGARSGYETGVPHRKVSGRPRSALQRRGARTPIAAGSINLAAPSQRGRRSNVASFRSSSAHFQEGQAVSFVSLPEVDVYSDVEGEPLRRSSSSTTVQCDARHGIELTGVAPITVGRLDAVLAEKLAAADRELILAQGAAARFAQSNQVAFDNLPINSPFSSDFSTMPEDLSTGRKSEDYDAKLAAKMREIEVLQKQTEDSISRLASSRHPSRSSSKHPSSRETSVSPQQDFTRNGVHEKMIGLKHGSRSYETHDKSVSSLSHLDGSTGSTDVVRLSSGRPSKRAMEPPREEVVDYEMAATRASVQLSDFEDSPNKVILAAADSAM